ncbi:hypothetical protein C0989_009536, partial [Termitomyces sp. Mn162]
MRDNKRFMTFIVRFEREAYETGWNYNALQFALRHALPQRIKDILRLAPKQTTYNGYKALVTQVDQCYWEDRSENMAPRTSWNISGNTNWQAGATNGIQSSIPANPANPAPCFPRAEESPTLTGPRGSDHLPSSTLPTSMTPQYPWIPTPTIATTSQTPPTIRKPYVQTGSRTASGSTCQRKRRRNDRRRARLEDTLDCGPHPDIFSTPATLLRAMMLAPDNPPAHLPSHSSTNLLLRTTLPFTDKPVPTLVDSGATDNFVDKSLAALAPQPLHRLPALIPLKLFDGDSTPAGDITHCLETTLTFANGQQQELRLLVTKLHPSAPVVLG